MVPANSTSPIITKAPNFHVDPDYFYELMHPDDFPFVLDTIIRAFKIKCHIELVEMRHFITTHFDLEDYVLEGFCRLYSIRPLKLFSM